LGDQFSPSVVGSTPIQNRLWAVLAFGADPVTDLVTPRLESTACPGKFGLSVTQSRRLELQKNALDLTLLACRPLDMILIRRIHSSQLGGVFQAHSSKFTGKPPLTNLQTFVWVQMPKTFALGGCRLPHPSHTDSQFPRLHLAHVAGMTVYLPF